MLLIENKTLRQAVGMVETANLLLLKLLIKKPAHLRYLPGKMFRDYMSLVGNEAWQSRDIFKLFPEARDVRITLEPVPGEGISTPMDELAYLAFVTKVIGPKAVFEIGTFRGRTALNFALNAPDDCKVHTLDLPPAGRDEGARATGSADTSLIQQSKPGAEFLGRPEAARIEQLYGDSTRFDFTPYYDRMDIVFVDGAHHYAAALSDTRHALRMVRPGGVVLWHDFANYGDYNDVTRAVLECLPGTEVFQIDNSQLALYRKPG